MPYTFWSHGELLGESALDYVRVDPKLRTGDLHVTAKGLTIFDRISQTHADGYYAMKRLNAQEICDEDEEKTLRADFAAEDDQYEALALELRAPNGEVIPTEDIYMQDTEYLLAIGAEAEEENRVEDPALGESLEAEALQLVEELRAQIDEDHPPWAPQLPEREPVRFQIYVSLKDEWSIP